MTSAMFDPTAPTHHGDLIWDRDGVVHPDEYDDYLDAVVASHEQAWRSEGAAPGMSPRTTR